MAPGSPVTVSTAQSPSVRTTIPLLPFLLIVVAMAYVGWEMGAKILWGASRQGSEPRVGVIGAAIPTGFGSLTVFRVANLNGLTSGDVAGMTHGIPSLVLTDRQQVQASVLVVNTSGRRAPVDPAQFRLVLDGSPERLLPTGSTVLPVALAPGSRIEATFVFVIPRTQAAISLEYAPADGPAITIPALAASGAPAPSSDGVAH